MGSILKILLIPIILLFGSGNSAFGKIESYQELREFEKISLALTSLPLDDALRAKVLAGEMTKADLVAALLKDESFVREFGKFWAQKLGVVNVGNNGFMNIMRGTSGFRLLARERGPFNIIRFNQERQPTAKNITDQMNRVNNRNGRVRIFLRRCGSEFWLFHRSLDFGQVNRIINTKKYLDGSELAIPLENYTNLRNWASNLEPNCNQKDKVKPVTPYWDKEGRHVWKTIPYFTANNRCKADLSGCYFLTNTNKWHRGHSEDSNFEPGYIISKTVSDDLPFGEILTTSKTVMTERYAYLLQKHFPWWNENFPGGKYKEDKEPRWLNPDIDKDELFWIERGDQHSGVLSTFSFQFLTNGRRAKANRAYEVFMCSKFIVPDGAVPNPDDTNPDLRKRAYCAYCHRTLEPMSAFFNRWPKLGRVNYEFDASDKVDDSGFFDGKEGKGAKRFGEIVSQTEEFKKCAVRRTFEYTFGREPTEAEAKAVLPGWTALYKSSGENIREVITSMVQHELFHKNFAEPEVQTENEGEQ